jgi:hypothetical protein
MAGISGQELLDAQLQRALESPMARVRLAAIQSLDRQSKADDPAAAAVARAALEGLRGDSDPGVAAAAAAALGHESVRVDPPATELSPPHPDLDHQISAPPPPPARLAEPSSWGVMPVVIGVIVLFGALITWSIVAGPHQTRNSQNTNLVTRPTATPGPTLFYVHQAAIQVFADDFSRDEAWTGSSAAAVVSKRTAKGLNLSVTAVGQTYRVSAPSATYQHDRIDASIRLNNISASEGVIAISCRSEGGHSYDFWLTNRGMAAVEHSTGNGSDALVSRSPSPVANWNAGTVHDLTAICYSDGSVVHLELLADEKPVLSITDATFAGDSFRPAIVVQGPVDIDVLHLSLSTL